MATIEGITFAQLLSDFTIYKIAPEVIIMDASKIRTVPHLFLLSVVSVIRGMPKLSSVIPMPVIDKNRARSLVTISLTSLTNNPHGLYYSIVDV